MIQSFLNNHTVILASGSPRRHHFFKELGIDFKIDVREVEEIYPEHLKREAISNYLAELKAEAFNILNPQEIVITSDTIVWHNEKALGKPKTLDEAKTMLQSMSNQTHEVITSVCFKTATKIIVKHHTTQVTFKTLTDQEIEYYVETHQPLDKAGAYGIQEWIGYIGITSITGSFFTVMGLPTHIVYETLIELAKS
ncbi:Maf-like protein [Aquimarina intermedia]|uniref:dTTP/UTP pyrophosphatase n=1 Tax=Aquimarina intermedia TaxID=350814 RepID=A0A5S5BZH5_9FLAO|nr:Maf-like protein [Aquimarina intermedia]TYP71470.1 septum formation protein [Aquimarina intermedia]